MPLYEYTCNVCSKRYSVLVGMTAVADSDVCPHCGADQATRRISRFSRVRSDDEVTASMADPESFGDLEDPKAMRRWATEMGREMGEDLGDEFDEYMDEAARGGDGDGDGLPEDAS